MTTLAPCTVTGCAGRVTVDVVDGKLVESACAYCARRLIFAREVLGAAHPAECGICRAPLLAHPNGRVYRTHCDPCKPLAARDRWRRCNAKRARDAAREKKVADAA